MHDFPGMIALRNKTAAHTFLPSFDHAGGWLSVFSLNFCSQPVRQKICITEVYISGDRQAEECGKWPRSYWEI